jgi:GntR family transcriptional regulator
MGDNEKLEFESEYINRDSSYPLYKQIENFIRNKIETKEWQVGQNVPPEQELAKKFGVSINTVKSAVKILINEGYLSRKKGKGTYISQPKIQEALVQKLVGFYEDMTEKGYSLYSKVLTLLPVHASTDIAEKLEMGKRELVINLERIRYINNEPICLVSSYYPYELCSGLLNEDLSNQSVYGLLETKYGLYVVRARRNLEAIVATKEDAKLLGIRQGDPIQLLESIAYLDTGRPVEYYIAKHRGDRSKFGVVITRSIINR